MLVHVVSCNKDFVYVRNSLPVYNVRLAFALSLAPRYIIQLCLFVDGMDDKTHHEPKHAYGCEGYCAVYKRDRNHASTGSALPCKGCRRTCLILEASLACHLVSYFDKGYYTLKRFRGSVPQFFFLSTNLSPASLSG